MASAPVHQTADPHPGPAGSHSVLAVQRAPRQPASSISPLIQRSASAAAGSSSLPSSNIGAQIMQLSRNPASSAGAVLQLQRSYGNQAVGGMLQKQANGGGPGASSTSPSGSSTLPGEAAPTMGLPSDPGKPLDESTRAFMESRFGEDFRQVKIHDDAAAASEAEALGANAFTMGRDIYFAAGRYDPHSPAGRSLLAHELTHTIQQGGTNREQTGIAQGAGISQPWDQDERQAEKAAEQVSSGLKVNTDGMQSIETHPIQRQNLPLAVAVGMPYDAAVLIGKTSVYDLKGKSKFEPDLFLKIYLFDQHNEALVNVRFGDLAKGRMYIRKDPSGDYSAFPTPLLMKHPDIAAPGGGKSLSLIVSIGTGSMITGSIGVTAPLPPNSIGPAYGSPEDQERFLALLIGQTATHGKLRTIKVQNELDHGALSFWYVFADDLYTGTTLYGGILIFNEQFAFSGLLLTSGKGMQPKTSKIERDKTGDLFGRMELHTEWEGRGFTGTLNGTYEDGILEILGTLKYNSPRVKGELNVLATEENRAWDAINKQLEAIQPAGGGSSGGQSAKSGSGTSGTASSPVAAPSSESSLALSGWGVLKLMVTDKVEADAAFVVDPDGYLTVRGTIRSPHKITLMDAKPTKEKTFFDEDYSEMVYVWWAVGVRAKVNVKLIASAVFGPLTLHDITITGIYSTRPGAGSELEISAKLNLSASAKARLEADGELAARLGTKYKRLGANLASVNLNIATEGEVRGVVEAKPTIKRQTKGSGSGDQKPQYSIGGELFVGGEIDLKLTGDLVFSAVGLTVHEIHLGEKVYPIAGFGLTTDVSYTLGSDEMPEINYRKGNFEPKRFIRQIVKEKRPRDTENQVKGGFKEDGKEVGHVVDSGDIPPAPPQPRETQVVQFSMDGRQHTLFLTLAGPGDPAIIEMASRREPIRVKILKAEKDLIDEKYDWSTDDATRRKIDRRLDDLAQTSRDAARVEEAGRKLGSEPENTRMDVPGFNELGDELHNYGERYHVTDLAAPTPGQGPSTGPAQPGPGPDLAAEDVMSSWPGLKKRQSVIDQVRRILDTGNLPQSQFKTIMDKTKANGAAGTRMLNYLEQLTTRNFSGIRVVFSDLEIGGNKFSGAEFMLYYIEGNDLWGSVTEFEAAREDRRIDAIIRRTQYEFKSWGEFRTPTFLEQIVKDYDRTALRGVRWVFRKRELGNKEKIIQLMTSALDDPELRKKYHISKAKSRSIIDELDRIVIVY